MPVHMIVVEHDAISDPNSRQGESPFAGTGLSQVIYRVLVPPIHVFVW
jgi:hypothetical protein